LNRREPIRDGTAEFATVSPSSQRHRCAVAILAQSGQEADTMRSYITAIGMAFGLVAVWAALVPFAA
jgi:hypothetical protein